MAAAMVITSVSLSVPSWFVAVSATLKVPAAVGVPERVAAAALKVSHAGRLVAVNVMGAVPLAVMVYKNGTPTVPLAVSGLVMLGEPAAFTTTVPVRAGLKVS